MQRIVARASREINARDAPRTASRESGRAGAMGKRTAGLLSDPPGYNARMIRYWDGALEKVRREGRCRLCPEVYDLQAAHTIGRKHDELVECEDGTVAIFVDPDDIVPLCVACHYAYDHRKVSLLEVLTHDEQAAAVSHIGIMRALQRLTGQRMIPHCLPVNAA